MLTSLAPILTDARRNRYAVPAFDCVEDVFVRAILETCQQRRAPAVLMVLEPDIRGNGWHYVSGLVKAVSSCHDIPIALHLDHATELDSIRRAVDLGFTSVMIDGSSLPFAENVQLTHAAVELAHPHGLSVEGELGRVGGMDLEETACADSTLTEPGEVARFVQETGVDALAVSIGTQHGVYRSLPTLNIQRLAELDAASPVPLVLHGGSGTPEGQIRAAVAAGICKLNIYADNRIAMQRGLVRASRDICRSDPLPHEVFGPMREEIGKVVGEKIDLLGAGGRV